LATRTYLLENGDDGLRDLWTGRVWLNPPYGKEAPPFMAKLAEYGRGTALLFARTETGMWHEHIWPKATAILFLRGRVSFLTPDGEKSGTSGAPSALIAYGAYDAYRLEVSGIPGQFLRLDRKAAA